MDLSFWFAESDQESNEDCENYYGVDDKIFTYDVNTTYPTSSEAPTNELKVIWQLTEMGFELEESMKAMKELNSIDIEAIISYIFSEGMYI